MENYGEDVNLDIMTEVLKSQYENLIDNPKYVEQEDSYKVIILDDLANSPAVHKWGFFDKFCILNRHYLTSLVITSQHINKLSTGIRYNNNYVYGFCMNNG